MRLIDADELVGKDVGISWVSTEAIENAPTVDAAPVVHGKWIPKYKIKEMYYSSDDVENYKVLDGFSCSRCGRVEYIREPYCNCGARMDGGC